MYHKLLKLARKDFISYMSQAQSLRQETYPTDDPETLEQSIDSLEVSSNKNTLQDPLNISVINNFKSTIHVLRIVTCMKHLETFYP